MRWFGHKSPEIDVAESLQVHARLADLRAEVADLRRQVGALERSETLREATMADQIDALRRLFKRVNQRVKDSGPVEETQEPSDIFKLRKSR